MYKSILVNKDNKLKEKYLEKIKIIEDDNIKLEEEAYKNFIELRKYLKEINIDIKVKESFSKIEKEEDLYNDLKTGLSLIIDREIDEKILKEYGFIIRYPKNKEQVTNHQYSPFHIRYVGKIISKLIYEEYKTLEEYKENFSGVIIVNKEKGLTSYDVVEQVGRLFGIKKIGHTGTLDPLAEGVLIICLGKSTKIVELLTAEDKEYIAGVKLGIKTDSYDIEGKIIDKKEVPSNLKIEEVLNSYKKTYLQEVPIYSAVKVNGKKLYEYARNNIEVELPKKEVTIKEIELLNSTNDTFTFKAKVTKGCYIRSLINDIGASLNTYATMTSLIRTKQGNIKIDEAYRIEDIKSNNYKLYKIDELLTYKTIIVDKDLEFKISNGVKIDNIWNIEDKVIFKNKDNKLLGIYEKDSTSLKVWKNFI